MTTNINEQFLRVRDLCNAPERQAREYVQKNGTIRIVQAQKARKGILGVCNKTLYRWVQCGLFPQPIKISAAISVWRRSDVDAWMAQPTLKLYPYTSFPKAKQCAF